MRHLEYAPPPAEPTPPGSDAGSARNGRGGLQPPHTALGAGRISDVLMATRVLTVKLDFTREQWERLRELAWQAMQYKNWFSLAHWSKVMKLRPPTDEDKNAETFIRARYTGQLSGAAYSAAEREITAAWTRDGKKILAGAPIPQYRHANSLSIRGHKNRPESGVRITEFSVGRFGVQLQAQSQECEGGCWFEIPLAKGTEVDKFQGPILSDMARGKVPILKGTVVFHFERYRMELKLAYQVPVRLPPIGARVATLGLPTGDDKRLLLRSELQTIDYTHKLHTLQERKTHWDGCRRRVMCQIGRRKHGARTKREALTTGTFEEWCRTYLHQWSHEVIRWCVSQGIGRLVVIDLSGGDWPAHQFKGLLEYKGQEHGIEVTGPEAASLGDASTERTVTAKVKKRQRRARKLGDATREIQHQLKGGNS